MARYIDPLYIVGWLALFVIALVAALTWIVLALLRKKRPKWPGYLLIIVVLLLPVWACVSWGWIMLYAHVWAAPQTQAYAPGVVIKLDASGRPLLDHGQPIPVVGAPREPGAYRVFGYKGRYFDIYLPDTYRAGAPVPCGFFLHGDNESQPEKFPHDFTELAKKANSQGMIAVFLVAQRLYTIWGVPQYAWNAVDSLSGVDDWFDDDMVYLGASRDWVLSNLNVDFDKIGFGGLSGGAVMATSFASGWAPANWFFSCGGTMFEWQLKRQPKILQRMCLLYSTSWTQPPCPSRRRTGKSQRARNTT